MTTDTTARTVRTIWEVWTYDVWGNAADGYEVNDRSCIARAYPINAPVTRYNAGTPGEFDGAYPTDAQIREALGLRDDAEIACDGDDMGIYVESAEDGYPLGELICTSHESLSPVRAVRAEAE